MLQHARVLGYLYHYLSREYDHSNDDNDDDDDDDDID